LVTGPRGWFVPCVALASLSCEAPEEVAAARANFEGASGPTWVVRARGAAHVLVRSEHTDTHCGGALWTHSGLSRAQVAALGLARFVAGGSASAGGALLPRGCIVADVMLTR
jgi:hypothetical protein